jgi:hypothetical protein
MLLLLQEVTAVTAVADSDVTAVAAIHCCYCCRKSLQLLLLQSQMLLLLQSQMLLLLQRVAAVTAVAASSIKPSCSVWRRLK